MTISRHPVTTVPDNYWRECWKQQRLARLAVPNYSSPDSFWNNRKRLSEHFIKNLDSWRKEAEERIAVIGVKDGSRVLDIGAGTGSLAVPLAAHGCDVIAVEPAEAMREALDIYARQQKVQPITVIPKRWEDVEHEDLGEPFDIVFASYSLMITDIVPALAKMQAVCEGQVHLFWFLTQPYTSLLNMALWPKVHGSEFPGEPTTDCLWEVLYEMGIYANLAVEASCEPAYFPTTEDAAKDFCKRLDCTTPEQERDVREYCGSSLTRTSKGYRVAGDALGAHLWWDVRTT
jgi:SAM-dependent methyltransferase